MTRSFFKSLKSTYQAHKPLAWAQLSHQKVRLAVALTGVAFSNILIFTQLGLRAMLFDGTTRVQESLNGDLFLISAFAPSIDWGTFSNIYLYQADALDSVESASPLYIGSANWVNPEDLGRGSKRKPGQFNLFPNRVKVLAFNPTQPVFNLPEVNSQLDRLDAPGSLLFDRLSQDKLGPVPELMAQQGVVASVMDRQRVYVSGLFSLGSTMFDSGHVIMSDWNYSRLQSSDLKQINVGVLKLTPGADRATVQAQLQQTLPDSVRVLTQEELVKAEQDFQASDPSGTILTFGALMGFIVGVIIVYQVLYTDVSDHLPEYATLKAMGYSDRALLLVVLQEAVILAVLGFIPGFFISLGTYQLLTMATKIPLAMKASVVIQVFLLTLIMCAVSGTIAMNKLRSADPADVF